MSARITLDGTRRRRPGLLAAILAPGAVARLAAAAGIFLLAGASLAQAAQYLLGPEDEVRVKVYEWRPSRDTIFPWTALNDTFTVGPDGWLSLPLAGRIKAGGRSSSEVEKSIGESLKENMGLAKKPQAAVEVVKFRPFYVAGRVTKPGEFPYRPGLTVLQAISLAGGLPTVPMDFNRFQREVIQGEGDISLLKSERVSLLARISRLKAEMGGAKSISFADALMAHRNDELVKTAMQQETAVFDARKDGMETQIQALTNLATFLDKETGSLSGQIGYLDKQVVSIQKELGSVTALVKKGLAAAPRQFELERSLAQAQSQRLAAETSLLQAKQEIGKTEVSIIELKDGRRNEVATSLRQAQNDLEQNTRKQATSRLLLQDSAVTAPRLMAEQRSRRDAQPVYTILRPTADGKVTEISARDTTPVAPGDTVKVEIPVPADDGIGLSGPAATDATGFGRESQSQNALAGGTASLR